MIHSVRIRGFKRFRDAEFRFPGHVVLTGPNDIGKTTVLQDNFLWIYSIICIVAGFFISAFALG